jgi:hypothetical protein
VIRPALHICDSLWILKGRKQVVLVDRKHGRSQPYNPSQYI